MRLYFGLAVSSKYQATTANELKSIIFQYGCFLAKYFCEYLLLFFNKPVYSCKDTTTIHNETPKNFWNYFRPNLTFFQHINVTLTKENQKFNSLKALTSSQWSKQKELIVSTFKAITRPILKYANTICSPIILNTNIAKLQKIRKRLENIANGCIEDPLNIYGTKLVSFQWLPF